MPAVNVETMTQKYDEQNVRPDQRSDIESKGEWLLVPDSLGQHKHDSEWMLTLPYTCFDESDGKQIRQKLVIEGSS